MECKFVWLNANAWLKSKNKSPKLEYYIYVQLFCIYKQLKINNLIQSTILKNRNDGI